MGALQFVEYLGSAGVDRIGWVPGTQSKILELRGSGFVDVVDVFVNGAAAPEFLEMSPTRLLVTVPTSQLGVGVSAVSVRTAGAGAADAAVINFRLASRGTAEGITGLVQRFLYALLTTPGSDIWNPSFGAGFQRIVAASMGTTTRALASRAVSDAEAQVIQAQARSAVPDTQRLASARLSDLRYDRASCTTSVRVELRTVAGQQVGAGIRV